MMSLTFRVFGNITSGPGPNPLEQVPVTWIQRGGVQHQLLWTVKEGPGVCRGAGDKGARYLLWDARTTLLSWPLEPGRGQPGRMWCGANSKSLSTWETMSRVRRMHFTLPSYSSTPTSLTLSKGINTELIVCILQPRRCERLLKPTSLSVQCLNVWRRLQMKFLIFWRIIWFRPPTREALVYIYTCWFGK